MKKSKSAISLTLAIVMLLSVFVPLSARDAAAAEYTKIPALQISRVYQPHTDENGLCYWASMATVQGYCLGSYTYKGTTTNYRVPGQDYNYLNRGDAITKFFKDTADGYANNYNNLTKYYPVKMTRVTDGIGKNAATCKKIYDQLALGKPVIVYTGSHASVVIGYSGSTSSLELKGFTVMEIKKDVAKTQSGYWWENSASYYNKHANSPQIDSKTLSTNGTKYMSCYVNLESWISYCGNKLQEICYPTNAVSDSSEFSFDANGGTGSIPSTKITYGNDITIPECSFTKENYTFAGYNVYRVCDKTWYCPGNSWQSTQNIRDNNLSRKVYLPDETYKFSSEWLRDGGVMGTDFIFYPVWKPEKTSLDFYANHSGTNYMMSVNKDTFSEYYQSRDNSVYTLNVTETFSPSPVLVIEGKAPGASGKDMLFKTQTNKGINYNDNAGDNKDMTLTFRAKSSVDGAKMFIRWGYTTDTATVTLSTEWQEYVVNMSKQPNDGAHLHPYFDKAGTFFISDIVLCDKNADTPLKAETGTLLYSHEYPVGKAYGTLPTPYREGYIFKGWYTSKQGGARITKSTIVLPADTAVYARWIDAHNTETVLMGDTDLSGVINVKDATLIQKSLADIVTLSDKQAFAGNVISGDVLNVRDATSIQKWCAGMDTGIAVVNVSASFAK